MDLLFHSDRGIQYASKTFRTFIKSNPLVTQSMSRKGNCWDNSVAESFFKTLKVELIYDDDFKTIEQAKLLFLSLLKYGTTGNDYTPFWVQNFFRSRIRILSI